MPWELAKGLLPGRGPAEPPPSRRVPIPCDEAKGLLPGRGAPPGRPAGRGAAPGRGAPGRGAPPCGLSGRAAGRGPGVGAPPGRAAGASDAGAAGLAEAAGASGAAGAGASGALGPGVGAGAGAGAGAASAAGAAGVAGPGLGPGVAALVVAAGAAGAVFLAAAFLAPASGAGGFSWTRRTTGASMVELADLTNSPISLRCASSVLLDTPSSLASSWTRTLATFLLLWSASREGADRRQCRGVLIAEYSSGAHQRQTRSRSSGTVVSCAAGAPRPTPAARRCPPQECATPGRRPDDGRRGRDRRCRGGAMPHDPAAAGADPGRQQGCPRHAAPRPLAAGPTGYPCADTRCRSAGDPPLTSSSGVQSGRSAPV